MALAVYDVFDVVHLQRFLVLDQREKKAMTAAASDLELNITEIANRHQIDARDPVISVTATWTDQGIVLVELEQDMGRHWVSH
jgi:hypothetical protein